MWILEFDPVVNRKDIPTCDPLQTIWRFYWPWIERKMSGAVRRNFGGNIIYLFDTSTITVETMNFI